MTVRDMVLNAAGRWETRCATPRSLALTFDDGPHSVTTEKLLGALEKLQVKATMFVSGKQCRGRAGLLVEMQERGHVIANHGYVHKSHAFRGTGFVTSSILQTQYTLEDFGITPGRYFRPPFGMIDWNTAKVTRGLGFRPVLWTAHAADWKPQSHEDLARRMLGSLAERSILLLHDGKETTERVIEVLPRLCEEVRRRGWEFVTLDTAWNTSGASV